MGERGRWVRGEDGGEEVSVDVAMESGLVTMYSAAYCDG